MHSSDSLVMNFVSYPLTIYAFHGCERKIAEKVLAGECDLQASENKWDWLGSGVYFWENAPERAYMWAVQSGKKDPAVVGAVINLGSCLNLMDKSSNRNLYDAYRSLVSLSNKIGKTIPENRDNGHFRDASVINMAHAIAEANGSPYDTVRAAFVEGAPVFDGSAIRSDTHIQICVRDPKKSIVAYFRPRTIG